MAKAGGVLAPGIDAIRPPLAARACIAIFALFWCGVVAMVFVLALAHGSPAALIPLIMLAVGASLFYRLFRVSVEMRESELLVRNYFRTHHIPREDVEGFRVGPTATQPLSKAIHVLIRGDQVVPLDVTARPYFFRRGRNLLAQRLEDLKHWSASR